MDRHISDAFKNIHIGFHRMNVRYMKKNLILVNGSTLFVYALLDQAGGSNVFTVTILLSCCMVSFLLWFAYLFQYTTEQVRRGAKLGTLLHIGYTKEQLKQILRKEVFSIYGTTLLFFTVIYLPVTVSHISRAAITLPQLALVGGCYLIPLTICMVVSLRFYNRVVDHIKTVR